MNMNISCRIANANTQCGLITNPPERRSNKYYREKKIGSSTLRRVNEWFRNKKLPGNNWRVNAPGHYHIIKKKK